MLTVHHLNNSRSQRVIWLLEDDDHRPIQTPRTRRRRESRRGRQPGSKERGV